jgi:hypothetical protein
MRANAFHLDAVIGAVIGDHEVSLATVVDGRDQDLPSGAG